MLDLDALIADDDEPAVAAITIAELGVGVETSTGKRRNARRGFLDDIISSCQSSNATWTSRGRTPSSSWRSARQADRAALTTSSSPQLPSPPVESSSRPTDLASWTYPASRSDGQPDTGAIPKGLLRS